eukprot:106516_1
MMYTAILLAFLSTLMMTARSEKETAFDMIGALISTTNEPINPETTDVIPDFLPTTTTVNSSDDLPDWLQNIIDQFSAMEWIAIGAAVLIFLACLCACCCYCRRRRRSGRSRGYGGSYQYYSGLYMVVYTICDFAIYILSLINHPHHNR